MRVGRPVKGQSLCSSASVPLGTRWKRRDNVVLSEQHSVVQAVPTGHHWPLSSNCCTRLGFIINIFSFCHNKPCLQWRTKCGDAGRLWKERRNAPKWTVTPLPLLSVPHCEHSCRAIKSTFIWGRSDKIALVLPTTYFSCSSLLPQRRQGSLIFN